MIISIWFYLNKNKRIKQGSLKRQKERNLQEWWSQFFAALAMIRIRIIKTISPVAAKHIFFLLALFCKMQNQKKIMTGGNNWKESEKESDVKKQNETRMCKWDLVSFRHAQLVGTFVHPDRRALHVRLYRVHHLSLCCHDWLFSGVLDSTWSWTMAARSLKIWLTSPMSDSSWATLRSRSCKYSRFCSSSSISCFRIMGQDSRFNI